MADIIIKGMGMPKTCHECPLNVSIYTYDGGDETCALNAWDGYSEQPKTTRHPDCPLFPLPEGHGRLGDLETAEAILHNKAFDLAGTSAEYNALNWALRQIKALPTIIEADLEWKMKNCCCFSNTDQAEGGTEDGN